MPTAAFSLLHLPPLLFRSPRSDMVHIAARLDALLSSLAKGFAKPCATEAAGEDLLQLASELSQDRFASAVIAAHGNVLSSSQRASLTR